MQNAEPCDHVSMGVYRVVRSDLLGRSLTPDECWLLFPIRGETAASPLRYIVKVELMSAVISSSPEIQKMFAILKAGVIKHSFKKNIHMPVLIFLAALNYQHPRGLLSFSLEVQLFSFSPFTALGPQQDSGGLEPPLQGRMPKATVVPSSHWPSCFPLHCPISGDLLRCHPICK